ncbi:hypothetical protein BurJ1DRAFT_2799 [Burkholderiales bacterium JOSHI_001]|nr:hypothetical protein BurJ1DRAFT_2799 [Burkholderiales bacterium JOSHI_001]
MTAVAAPGLGARARARASNWFVNRLPRSDTQSLHQGNIYIVPSVGGFAFAATLLVMLLASINYQLNLGYLLTFLLAGCAGVSMHLTHGTLRGLTLRVKAPPPGFAGDSAPIELVLTSPDSTRHGIGLAVREAQPYHFAWCDVPAQGSATAHVTFALPHRGLHALPTLVAETRFPLGLFRAWTVLRPAAQALAWPRPEPGLTALPPASPTPGAGPTQRSSQGGEFDGVRSYRRGDTLRQVVWKKVARTGELVARDSSENASRELWLDYADTAGKDPEQRLSRLAAWVLAAERQGLVFGLRLPGLQLPPATGDAQRRAALDALALWQPGGGPPA